jgi:hypothetical protein
MTHSTSFVMGSLFLILAAGGEALGATRLALIVGPGGPEVRSVIDLATAKLSEVRGVELLERAGIDRVLAEQKLTLAGLADAGQAVIVGKLLSADVLSVVEPAPDGKSALGLVVFDARTGLRLWDAALPAGGPDKQADGVADALKAALKKHAAGKDGLRTVGFVSVRNADLPQSMDSFCDSLGQMIERRLVAAPSVGVLERQRLEAVTGERALPTQASEKNLLGSLVQLDLEVRRGPKGEGLSATVLLSNPKGKRLGKVSYRVKPSDPTDAIDALAKGICEALKATPAKGDGEPAREGVRFLVEAKQLWSFKQYNRALRAAESAHALAPADPAIRALLSQYLITHGGDQLSSKRPFFDRRITAEPEVVARAAGLAQRGLELRSVGLHNVKPTDVKALIAFTSDFKFENELTIGLMKFVALDERQLTPEAKKQVAAFRTAVEAWLCDEYLEKLAVAAEKSGGFQIYSSQIEWRMVQLRLTAPDAQRFTRKLIGVMERWLDVAAKQKLAQLSSVVPWQTFMFTTELAKRPLRWSPGPRELELFDRLFDKMDKHPYPLIRFQGKCGHLWVALHTKNKTPEECYKGYLTAKRELLEVLQDKRRRTAETEWVSYCKLSFDIFGMDCLGFNETKHQMDEIYDLSDMILSRNILVYDIINAAILVPLKPVPKPARKLDLLDRILAALDNPKVNYYGGDRNAIKSDIALYRTRFISDNPELAGKQTSLPWDNLKVLLDVADLPGIRELKCPVVLGGDIYVTGLGGEPGNKEFIQPFRVPLDGKPVQPLAKVPVTWRTIRNNPFSFGFFSKIPSCQLGAKELYVATRTEGLYAFPLNGGAARRIDSAKLPSESIECFAFHDGRLYVALGGGYLISMDPASGKFDVLASSRRKDKVSPFDDGEAFAVTSMVPDPRRQRLLFVLLRGRTQPKSLNGLWALDPKTRTFEHLLETNGTEFPISCRMTGDDQLFMASTTKAVDYDLAKGKHTLLFAKHDPNGTVLVQKTALCQEPFRGEPALYRDGWMWMTTPLSRVSIADNKQVIPPEPKRKGNTPAGNPDGIVPLGKDRLLYGTDNSLWLLTLRKK